MCNIYEESGVSGSFTPNGLYSAVKISAPASVTVEALDNPQDGLFVLAIQNTDSGTISVDFDNSYVFSSNHSTGLGGNQTAVYVFAVFFGVPYLVAIPL